MNGAPIQPNEAPIVASGTPPVYFFVPADSWPDDMTPDTGYFWSANRSGTWNWTVQTHQKLVEAGFPCQLAGEIPSEGIIVAHSRLFDESFVPNSRQLLVCIEADRGRHAFAQLHVQQNPGGARAANEKPSLQFERQIIEFPASNHFIHYWPQPDLRPRDRARGDRFERVSYVGRAKNLTRELRTQAWSRRMREHGFRWLVEEERMAWQDYRRIDAVLAVRDFAGKSHLHKPASKLHNAWRAGVPAVLGPETAYRSERRGELDYLEIHSPAEALTALIRLRDDVALRKAMVANGRMRAREVTAQKTTEEWQAYLLHVAIPAHEIWLASSDLARRSFVLNRRVSQRFEFSRKRIKRTAKQILARTPHAPL